jgi:hypothetical protein
MSSKLPSEFGPTIEWRESSFLERAAAAAVPLSSSVLTVVICKVGGWGEGAVGG